MPLPPAPACPAARGAAATRPEPSGAPIPHSVACGAPTPHSVACGAPGCRDRDTCPNGDVFPADAAEALLTAVFRFIGAAYETGDAACWEAAHVRAEAVLASADAALLVARATAVVRVIRIDRPDFGFLPTPCRRLSADEIALLRLVRAAGSEATALRRAADILDNAGGIRLLAAAAAALVGRAWPAATAPFAGRARSLRPARAAAKSPCLAIKIETVPN